ncbi:acetolactate synthase I/II/III large subunit [Pseudoclavibacter endophyticus]|uniref:Thiamine pyrophosphate-binding protein n=1 Tax=Pseudoclavibacter endophyticus TaxID=1778590 RepID=A0A6H9WPH4_9MICO|nr:thiamine pyrophosphate-binding protein [Pseudoclavibacter endophyticus]KAB1647805.1 thiamine pyrophosphate-binding protein [Pseudoclavibacter endophyticus]GGA72970.1 acetolactate synthase I/II/III large subunit [Pseudoclavibacter endophyticus]
MSTPRTTVADAIGRTLATLGVQHAFGVVGSGNFTVTNALVENGVPFTAARHEMGAACMADAYARMSDTVSVLSLHQGCGLTNALTGIAEAAKSHTPMVVLTGDTAIGDRISNFDIDQDASAAALGAIPMRVDRAEDAVRTTARAYRVALHERATVVLSLPVDVQELTAPADEVAIPEAAPRPRLAPESVEAAVELLAGAQRPLIVAGRGGRAAGPQLRALAEAAGALLTTSATARGLFVDDDWALDIMGGFSTEPAADLIRDADVIVVFGAALTTWTTRGGDLVSRATVVQVDDRPEAFGLHRPVDLAVLGDAAAVAEAMTSGLRDRGAFATSEHPRYRTAETGKRVRAARYWSEQPHTPERTVGFIDPVELINEVDRLLPLERVVATDGGNVNCFAGAHLRVPDEHGYCLPFAFQSIGLGLASAIGAAIAQPDRLPVLGTGDGSLLMTGVELETAVRLGLGMVIVVFNDAAYGAEVHLFADQTDRHGIVRFPDTDIAAIARGYGCEGATVRSLDDLGPLHAWLAGPRDRPIVLDAKITGAKSWMMARGH